MSQVEESKNQRKPRGKKPATAAAAEGEAKPAADNRPKTAGRGKRTGAAGQDANKKNGPKGENKNANNQRRPQTARDAANAAEGNNETPKEERKGEGNRGGKGNNNRKN